MPKKTALITGVTGQDGSYLTDLLLKKNYKVIGVKRRSSSFNTVPLKTRLPMRSPSRWTRRNLRSSAPSSYMTQVYLDSSCTSGTGDIQPANRRQPSRVSTDSSKAYPSGPQPGSLTIYCQVTATEDKHG